MSARVDARFHVWRGPLGVVVVLSSVPVVGWRDGRVEEHENTGSVQCHEKWWSVIRSLPLHAANSQLTPSCSHHLSIIALNASMGIVTGTRNGVVK